MQSIPPQQNAWYWQKYHTELLESYPKALPSAWLAFDWETAINNYREQVQVFYSYTRIFGQTTPVSLEGIFTDVFILEQPLETIFQTDSNADAHCRLCPRPNPHPRPNYSVYAGAYPHARAAYRELQFASSAKRPLHLRTGAYPHPHPQLQARDPP